MFDGDVDSESLEENNNDEHHSGSKQVGDVGKTSSVESLLESADLIGTGQEEMEESNDSALKLVSGVGTNGVRGERRPNNRRLFPNWSTARQWPRSVPL